jgi:predicted dehydrogenase
MAVSMALVGAGQRGTFAYGPYARKAPNELRFVAVAEPQPDRRSRFAALHGIPPERQFSSWEDLLDGPRLADAVLVATPDRLHHAPAVGALEAGYDVLVEKPMATKQSDLNDLVATADRTGRLLQVCHVLRYTPFFQTLHEVLASGRLGDIVSVSHRENFIYWHMAHSFVRGNWSRAEDAAPMILAKACHDFDIISWNLADPVVSLQSFGSLLHFRVENAPIGAPPRCTDGCPAATQCPFDATRLYLNDRLTGWPVHVISNDLSPAGRLTALRDGPYGRCVYRCDNDVVDHQVVAMGLTSGATVSLTVQGHSHEEARTMRYDGTRGTLRARFGLRSDIEIHDHQDGHAAHVPIPSARSGHGGGDFGVIRAFLAARRGDAASISTAREVLESHLLALAAEQSRLTGRSVDMERYRTD